MQKDKPAEALTARNAPATDAEFDPIIVKIPIDDDDLRYLLSFKGERPKLDFKSAYDDAAKKDTVGIVKDIVAMANTEGGYIVLGAGNNGRACGLAAKQADAVDDAKIASRLSSYLGASVEIHVSHHTLDALALVVITVPRARQLLVFEKDGQYAYPAHAEFRAGDVFVRHSSKSERWNQEDVRLYNRMHGVLCKQAISPTNTLLEAADKYQAEFRYRGRPVGRRIIGTTLLVKGLEFDHAIVLDAGSLAASELYVALTRGAKSLTVVSSQRALNPDAAR